MQKQVTHNNHYVPQFYLKYWSNNGNSILTHDLLVAHQNAKAWRGMPIKGIACWPDFYTWHDVAADDAIEDELSRKYESPAKGVFQKVIAGGALSDGEMDTLVDYLVLQAFRTPAWLNQSSRVAQEYAGPTFESVVREAVGLSRDELMKKRPTSAPQHPFPQMPLKVSINLEEGCAELRMDTGRQFFEYSIGHILGGPVGEALHSCAWRVVSLRHLPMIPTSDNPVVLPDVRQGGSGTAICLPLSPRHLLFTEFGRSREEIDGTNIDEATVIRLRRAIIRNASRYVFSKQEIPDIESIRPRAVDPERCAQINKERRVWDEEQSELEREYKQT